MWFHTGGEGRLGLILGLTCVVALDLVAVLVPGFAGSEEGRVWLCVSQCWSGGGELGDIAVDEFHLQCAKVVRVGHFVWMLDYEIRIGVWLTH